MTNLLAFLASATLITVSARAHGYCRTTTCDRLDAPADCFHSADGCSADGVPVRWPGTCVSTSVSTFGSPKLGISADILRSVVHDAFGQWTSTTCPSGEGPPRMVVDTFPDVNCVEVTGEKIGYKEKGPNYNIWIFRDTEWEYASVGENAIAITTTQFSETTGEIYDSDVELNSLDNVFTLGDDNVDVDLSSVVLHEAGHFLGLAHSDYPSSVMTYSLSKGDSRRHLTSDDIDGICAAYPPGPLDPSCDPEPRHGFSTECQAEQVSCSISGAPGKQQSGNWAAALVGVVLLGTLGARRRKLRS
jgi:hypothetical protein